MKIDILYMERENSNNIYKILQVIEIKFKRENILLYINIYLF
jgi:hypothetical protein